MKEWDGQVDRVALVGVVLAADHLAALVGVVQVDQAALVGVVQVDQAALVADRHPPDNNE